MDNLNIQTIRDEFQDMRDRSVSAKQIWQTFLSRNGRISEAFNRIGELESHTRKEFGQELNALKQEIQEYVDANQETEEQTPIDLLPVAPIEVEEDRGHLSLISQTLYEIQDVFERLGFSVAQGPQMETEWFNFDALNIPVDHPARDMWDTIWVEDKTEPEHQYLMRTHTSPVQIHHMHNTKPPYRVIAPGVVYRYEATDATHETVFHQVEGLMVDDVTTIATFKGVMQMFFRHLFPVDTEMRLRPSYFPFTEPSFEIDIRPPGSEEWLEIAGAGMVHKNVLENAGVDTAYQGFAFGMGVERIIMLKHGIDDLRHFHAADLRFIQQF